jgi:hypothetical protein
MHASKTTRSTREAMSTNGCHRGARGRGSKTSNLPKAHTSSPKQTHFQQTSIWSTQRRSGTGCQRTHTGVYLAVPGRGHSKGLWASHVQTAIGCPQEIQGVPHGPRGGEGEGPEGGLLEGLTLGRRVTAPASQTAPHSARTPACTRTKPQTPKLRPRPRCTCKPKHTHPLGGGGDEPIPALTTSTAHQWPWWPRQIPCLSRPVHTHCPLHPTRGSMHTGLPSAKTA